MSLRFAACAVLLATFAWPATAETVYRCADGYSQKPCPGGAQLQVGDERSAQQRLDSGAVARRDAKLAEQLHAARLKQEAQAPGAYIPAAKASPHDSQAAKPRGKAAKKDMADSEVFTAGVPGSAQGKKKAAPPKKSKSPA
jgi:hypothetical protein